MSKMCRFVLTGDLLRLNETALPPFAQQLVLADEEPQFSKGERRPCEGEPCERHLFLFGNILLQASKSWL